MEQAQRLEGQVTNYLESSTDMRFVGGCEPRCNQAGGSMKGLTSSLGSISIQLYRGVLLSRFYSSIVQQSSYPHSSVSLTFNKTIQLLLISQILRFTGVALRGRVVVPALSSRDTFWGSDVGAWHVKFWQINAVEPQPMKLGLGKILISCSGLTDWLTHLLILRNTDSGVGISLESPGSYHHASLHPTSYIARMSHQDDLRNVF